MDFLMRLSRQLSFKAAAATAAATTAVISDHHHSAAGTGKESALTTPQTVTDSTPALKLYTLKEVAAHCHVESCWMVICDRVYDFTEFIEFHPGGYEIMLEYGGTDATNAFNEKPHTLDAIDMLDKYLIGELVQADRMFQT